MVDSTEAELEKVMTEFTNMINQNEKVQKLIRKWSTSVLMWSRDHKIGFVIEISAGRVTQVRKALNQEDGKVKVVSSTETLISMMRGKENIAHLYMDGVVETYGSEKDQIVLDTVARLLWS